MDDLTSLRRVTVITVALALVIGVLSIGAGLIAVGGNVEAFVFGHPAVILGAGIEAVPLWRFSMLTDIFYSYLLLAPLALYLHGALRERGPWLADLGLMGALAYIGLGAASAASLAIASSSLIEAYATADAADRSAITTSWVLLRDIFYFGIWQTLDPITAGIWVFSVGWLLRPDRPLLGRLLVVLAGGLWLLSLMTMLAIHSLVVLVAIFGGALVVWVGWLAVRQR